jgi:hypothetical protein
MWLQVSVIERVVAKAVAEKEADAREQVLQIQRASKQRMLTHADVC